MGNAGVALKDPQGWQYNPAVLGLCALDRTIVFSPFSGTNLPAEVHLLGRGIAVPFLPVQESQSSRHGGTVSYNYLYLNSGDMEEITYEPVPTGRIFHWEDRAYQINFAYGYSGSITLGLGAAVKYIKQEVHDYSTDGYAFDVGLVLGYELITHPDEQSNLRHFWSAGLTVRNFGPDLRMIRDDYPLPRSTSLGLAYTFALDKPGPFRRWDRLSATAVIDLLRPSDKIWQEHFGAEVGFYEAVYGRIGWVSSENESEGIACGFSASTKGIVKLLDKSEGLLHALDLSYSAAYKDWGVLTDTWPHSVTFTVAY